MKLSICADIMYDGMEFEDKLISIANEGFSNVEFWSWSNKDIAKIKALAEKLDLHISCFCLGSLDRELMRALGAHTLNAGKKDELRAVCIESIGIAKQLGTKELIVTVGESIEGISYDEQIQTVKDSLNYIKDIFEEAQITLLVENINTKESATYLTPNARTVVDIVKEINSDHIKVLYDIYHQAMENDLDVEHLVLSLPYVGHIHIADVPGRNEPGMGTVDYGKIFNVLKENNYTGYIGAEFIPKTDEATAFELLRSYL